MWEREDGLSVFRRPSTSGFYFYDELELTNDEMRSIFDPAVNRILQLVEARVVCDLQAIVAVGGFSASPYLMRRIKSTFGGRVAAIVSPPCPGSAVCCGAVIMGIRSEAVVSRISKRTYGKLCLRRFRDGLDPEDLKIEGDSGEFWCKDVFQKFVSKGDEVHANDCVKHSSWPIRKGQKSLLIDIYSSDIQNPKYVTGSDMTREGSLEIDCPSFDELGKRPLVEVSMYFGRTEIQVTAIGTNFDSKKNETLPVRFERDSIY